MRTPIRCLFAAAGLLLAPAPGKAAVGELQDAPGLVNLNTAGDQHQVAIAAAADGRSVMVWTDTDADGRGIFLRRREADGRLGGVVAVPTTTAGDQTAARVAVSPAGQAAVVWVSQDQDGDASGVFLRLFAADGTPLSGELPVNQTTAGNQDQPDIAWHAGGWIVTWTGDNQDGDSNGVAARRFGLDGQPLGDEFDVNGTTVNSQSRPRVAATPDGRFVVAWESFSPDARSNDVFAQRFGADGRPQGGEIAVNPITDNAQERVALGLRPDGGFVVAWTDFQSDLNGAGIVARRFDADGAPLDNGRLINTAIAGNQTDPSVSVAADGTIWIGWTDASGDDDGPAVLARALNADGNALIEPQRLNTVTAGAQSALQLAADADGDLRAAWVSEGEDGDGLGVVSASYRGPQTVDLAAVMSLSPARSRPGGPVTITLGARNEQSPLTVSGHAALDRDHGAATGATLQLDAGGLQVLGADGGGWNCGGAGAGLSCSQPGVIRASETSTTVAQATAPAASGSYSLSLLTGARESDPLTSNNRTSVALQVSEPVLRLSSSASRIEEGGATVRIDLLVDPPSGDPVTVSYSQLGGDGQVDISPASPITIPADTAGAHILLTPIDDRTHEPDGEVRLSVDSVNGVSLDGRSSFVFPVIDDDPAPVAAFTGSARLSAAENGGSLQLTVALDRPSASDIELPFTLGGSAGIGSDLRLDRESPLRIAAGETRARITIELIDDLLTEADETLEITLHSPLGAVLGDTPAVTLAILDDESRLPPADVHFELATQRVDESQGELRLRAQLSRAFGETVVVPVQRSGSAGRDDATLGDEALRFSPGTTQASLSIRIIDDTLDEDRETLELELRPPSRLVPSSPHRHRLSIDDNDDPPAVHFTAATRTLSESSAPVSIPLRLSAASSHPVSVGIEVGGSATAGSDYSEVPAEVQFAAGETLAEIRLMIPSDGTPETDETLILSLVAPRNAVLGSPASLNLTIADARGGGVGGVGGVGGGVIGEDGGALDLLALLPLALLAWRRRRGGGEQT